MGVQEECLPSQDTKAAELAHAAETAAICFVTCLLSVMRTLGLHVTHVTALHVTHVTRLRIPFPTSRVFLKEKGEVRNRSYTRDELKSCMRSRPGSPRPPSHNKNKSRHFDPSFSPFPPGSDTAAISAILL